MRMTLAKPIQDHTTSVRLRPAVPPLRWDSAHFGNIAAGRRSGWANAQLIYCPGFSTTFVQPFSRWSKLAYALGALASGSS